VFPSRDSIAGAYSTYYTSHKARGRVRGALLGFLNLFRRSHLLRDVPNTARGILDYGCGSGEYLRNLASQGIGVRRYGCDISMPGDCGGAFTWIPMSELERWGGSFDWITLSHVIEHVPDPLAVLKQLRKLVSPDGGVWIATPSARSFLLDAFGRFARDIDFPRHRQVYSPECLRRHLVEAGFEVEFRRAPKIDAVLNYATCVRNLLRSKELTAFGACKVMFASSIRLVMFLLLPDRRSAELVVVARPA
jgi:SAM-dependent methyltransferase